MKAARIVLSSLLLALLAACGPETCREDFVGPPAPGDELVPVCKGAAASIDPVDRLARPETVR